jgi:hypothetical protein
MKGGNLMTNTATRTATQAAPVEPPNDAVRDDLKDILDRARDAIQEIEVGVDNLNGLMVELMLAADLPNRAEVEALADSLGTEANELFSILDRHLEELRRDITAAAEDDDEHDGSAQSSLSVG